MLYLCRSLQERPELGNVVNKVKDLIDAFNSDASKGKRIYSSCILQGDKKK